MWVCMYSTDRGVLPFQPRCKRVYTAVETVYTAVEKAISRRAVKRGSAARALQPESVRH
jgi:hypothetical protein